MNSWHEYLKENGAELVDSYVSNFGNEKMELATALSGHILCDLSHLGLLEVQGQDAYDFLQGQLTNDIKQLNGTNSQYTGYCNPKGRLLAFFLAFSHHDHIHLQLNGMLTESILSRLKMYILRSKVSIVDKSKDIVCFGLSGINAFEYLKGIFKNVPDVPYEIKSLEEATIIRLLGAVPRYLVFTPQNNAIAIWEKLNPFFSPAGKTCWDYLEIMAGIPDIEPSTKEEFVPQMLNLDTLGAINFKKGCYTGQEIVARTHYLGKVKRKTLQGNIKSTDQPKAGDDVYLDISNEVAGKIVRSSSSPESGYEALVEVRIEAVEAGKITWQGYPFKFREFSE